MKAHKMVRLFGLLIMFLAACSPLLARDGDSPIKSGQSVTLLPDGSTLLLGGFDDAGRPSTTARLQDSSGQIQKLSSGLQTARADHTATLLPDGAVLIFGGVNSDGQIVSATELFDPATRSFSTLTDVLALPRAFHTATVLTDGTVLLAGGVEAGGEFPDDVQLWDFRTHRALSQHALLMTPRQGHTAVLLADGAVRISGGTDHFGRPVLVDEIYDPLTRRFRFSTPDEMNAELQREAQAALQVAESIPIDGAAAVPINSFVAFRFTRILNVASVNRANFVLRGPNDSLIKTRVTPAENGRLAFVLPSAPLQPGTTYSLHIKNAADPAGDLLPETSQETAGAGVACTVRQSRSGGAADPRLPRRHRHRPFAGRVDGSHGV
ncbi:MAG TPA: kelch repeat-containing protein, partial [Candidatus Angelobacter sp.]